MKPSLAAVPLTNFLMKAVPPGEEQLRSSGDIQGGQGLKGPVGPAPRRPPPPQPSLEATPVPLSHLYLAAEQPVHAEQVGVIAVVVIALQ